MSETTSMWIWMAIALIDTYILIQNEMSNKGGKKRNERKYDLRSKKG